MTKGPEASREDVLEAFRAGRIRTLTRFRATCGNTLSSRGNSSICRANLTDKFGRRSVDVAEGDGASRCRVAPPS